LLIRNGYHINPGRELTFQRATGYSELTIAQLKLLKIAILPESTLLNFIAKVKKIEGFIKIIPKTVYRRQLSQFPWVIQRFFVGRRHRMDEVKQYIVQSRVVAVMSESEIIFILSKPFLTQ